MTLLVFIGLFSLGRARLLGGEPTQSATPIATALPAVVEIGVTVEPPPTAIATPAPTNTPTVTPTPIATPIPTAIPLPTSQQITNTKSIADVKVYLKPYSTQVLTALKPEILPALKIQAETTDKAWLQLCCFNLGTGVVTKTLWVEAKDVTVLHPEMLISEAVQQVIPLTETPAIQPTHFQVEAGPEFYATDNGVISIFVKVFRGPDGAQIALPGYLLRVRYKAMGQDEYVEKPATNVGAISIGEYTPFKNGIHIYNLKYEYDPGAPPDGKTKVDLLGAGDWEFWLTNAEGIELSRRIPFTTNPLNKNREIFISFSLVR